MNWYLKVLKQYADFDGRARRKEYWIFILFNSIISFVLSLVDKELGLSGIETGQGVLSGIYSLGIIIPTFAVSVRRMHDVGKSGWILLLIFLPVIGNIWLFILSMTNSDLGENKYGQNPKGITV